MISIGTKNGILVLINLDKKCCQNEKKFLRNIKNVLKIKNRENSNKCKI